MKKTLTLINKLVTAEDLYTNMDEILVDFDEFDFKSLKLKEVNPYTEAILLVDICGYAIEKQKELFFTVGDPGETVDFNMKLQPYIVGYDAMNRPFVWGYTDKNEVYYRLNLWEVYSLRPTGKNFKLRDDAAYCDATLEEHCKVIDGFTNIHRRY